jgi:asparagine synthase (glutamine-hydrolysing)
MAHGLETRVPFLDNDLVDFAMRCPVHLKLNNLSEVIRLNENEPGGKTEKYFKKTRDGKQILRDVMGCHIPGDVAKAEKQGFSAPDASWFKGESIDFVKRVLGDEHAALYRLMDKKTVSEMVGQHLDGTSNKRLLIWSLLNFNAWLEQSNVH